jgi:hypothetical protein
MSAVTRPIGRALGLSRTPTPPGPSQEELDTVSDRERRADETERDERTKLASQRIARRRGSRRNMLMSDMRDSPTVGVEAPQRTLGPGRNPRA